MRELIVHLEFAKVLGIVSLASILITIITFFISRENRIIKYIPGILLMIFGLYNILYLGGGSLSPESFNRFHMVIIGIISGVIGLATGLIIGVIKK